MRRTRTDVARHFVAALGAALSLLWVLPPTAAHAQELSTTEKLINALLEDQPEINPAHHVFLVWRGSIIKSETAIELVILKREGRTMVMTAVPELVKIMGKKKKRGWELDGLADVGSILSFDNLESNLESELESTFGLKIVGKSTVFLGG